MQEVGGSIPPGSTNLRFGRSTNSQREAAKVARRSPQGEGALCRWQAAPQSA